MSDSLKTIFLFIGLHWTVNGGCDQRNLDLKSDCSLGDLKKFENVFKKRAFKWNSVFFIVNLLVRPELFFFARLSSIRNTILIQFLARIVILNYYFNRKNLNLKKNYTKSEQNHAKYPVFTQNFNPR